MRLIGHLNDEENARAFGDYLYVQGVENQVEHDHGEGWGVWILDEDKLESASSSLKEFQLNPLDPKYRATSKTASSLRSEKEKKETAYRQKLKDRRHLFRPLRGYRFGPLTFVLIAISLGVALVSSFGNHLEPIHSLFITERHGFLVEIRVGEVWRLLTPIFIHFGPLHLVFNMLWLADLGSMVEGRQSPLHLAALAVVIGILSNVAQWYFVGPNFGGMSGVVYGLLGYVWIRGKFDPGSGLFLQPATVVMMLVWFGLGLVGFMNMANFAHAAGLGLGIAWGYLSSLRYR